MATAGKHAGKVVMQTASCASITARNTCILASVPFLTSQSSMLFRYALHMEHQHDCALQNVSQIVAATALRIQNIRPRIEE